MGSSGKWFPDDNALNPSEEITGQLIGGALNAFFEGFGTFEKVLQYVPEAVLNGLCKDIVRERERRGID